MENDKILKLKEWMSDLSDLILDANICVTNARRIALNKYENEIDLKKKWILLPLSNSTSIYYFNSTL